MVWWLCFLLSSQIAFYSFRIGINAETIEEIRASSMALLVSDSLSVVAGILAVFIVRSASLRQIARAERLGVEPAG